MPVQLTGDWGKLTKALKALASLDMAEVHKRIAAKLHSNTRMRFKAGVDPDGIPWRKPKWRQGQTLRDTGALLKSIHEKSSSAFAAVGTNMEYARIHQFGGVVKPKNAKALAIPWSKEARQVGYARRFPKKLALVWPKGKSGGWLIEPGKKSTKLHYLLRKQVTIPERAFLGITPADAEDVRDTIATFFKGKVR